MKMLSYLQYLFQEMYHYHVDQPTDWYVPMVVTPKSTGKVRVCVDLSKLNEFVKPENPLSQL